MDEIDVGLLAVGAGTQNKTGADEGKPNHAGTWLVGFIA
jgi:hypothetical protein